MITMKAQVKLVGDFNKLMGYVEELRKSNLVQGTDWEFEFHKSEYSYQTQDYTEKYILVGFNQDKHATFYTLKWA